MAGNPSEALAATARQSGSALAALAATARQAHSSQAVRTATRARTSAAKGVTRRIIGTAPSSAKKEKDGPAAATAVISIRCIRAPVTVPETQSRQS